MPTVRTQVEILREALERFRMGMYATRGNALHGTHSCPCVTCIAREALAAADEAPLVDEGDRSLRDDVAMEMLGDPLRNANERGGALVLAEITIRTLNARGSKR